MRHTIKFILICFVSITSASDAYSFSSSSYRDIGIGKYSYVGFGTYYITPNFGLPFCTFTILKHGVLLTARHCIAHQDNFSIKNLTITFHDSLVISGDDVLDIKLDSAENDFAYVYYDGFKTSGKINLPKIIISDTELKDTEIVEMPGYPNSKDISQKRLGIVSKNCKTTGKKAYFPPMPADPGYLGLLTEMDCPAFMGQSGSPILLSRTNEQGEMETILFGVLTHTFSIIPDGSVDKSKALTDDIGPYLPTSNFSPTTLSEDIFHILN